MSRVTVNTLLQEKRDLSVELLGTTYASPVMIAPMGYIGRLHPDCEVAIARAAVSGGVRSMVHANDDGSVSVWPKRSVARTRST